MSIALHVSLVLIGLSLTWTIIRLEDRPPSPIVEAGLPAVHLPAVMEITPIELVSEGPAPVPPAPEMEPLPDIEVPQVAPPIVSPGTPAEVAGIETVFAGNDLPPGDLVFVIDASGTMIPWFHAILDELERTLEGMRDGDRFAVILFRGSDSITVPPGRLRPAARAQRTAALRWLRDFGNWGGPARGSDPVAALEDAFSLAPSTIVLFSSGMDASSSFRLDPTEVLAKIATASTAAEATDGTAPVIRCVQLLPGDATTADPLLTAIAAAHGGGTVHLVTPEELDP